MYRIPPDLDLSSIVGQCITQIRVGKFDLQFEIGRVHFTIFSDIEMTRDGVRRAIWKEGTWPDPMLGEIINVNVEGFEIPSNTLINLLFGNGIQLHLQDDSDQYESMVISVKDNPSPLFT
jgi:hypothetical protein